MFIMNVVFDYMTVVPGAINEQSVVSHPGISLRFTGHSVAGRVMRLKTPPLLVPFTEVKPQPLCAVNLRTT